MAYEFTNSKGVVWYLHGKVVTLRGGRQQPIHYFRKSVDPAHCMVTRPPNMRVKECSNGLPVLKREAARFA